MIKLIIFRHIENLKSKKSKNIPYVYVYESLHVK